MGTDLLDEEDGGTNRIETHLAMGTDPFLGKENLLYHGTTIRLEEAALKYDYLLNRLARRLEHELATRLYYHDLTELEVLARCLGGSY